MPDRVDTKQTSGQSDWSGDKVASDQQCSPARRAFLKTTGLSALGAMIGMTIPFERNLPKGLVPVALAQDSGEELISGKQGLTLLSDRPLNVETPAHLLDDDVTRMSGCSSG